MYMHSAGDLLQIRRTTGETPFASSQLVWQLKYGDPRLQQTQFENFAVTERGWPMAMVGTNFAGANHFGAFAPKTKERSYMLHDIESSGVVQCFAAGPRAVVVGRTAGSDPARLFLVRERGKPLKIPDLGMDVSGAAVLGGKLLFLPGWSSQGTGLVRWGPGSKPQKVYEGRVDAIWTRNKILRRENRLYRFAWDGNRIRLGKPLTVSASPDVTQSTEVGRYLAFWEAENGPERPRHPRTMTVIDAPTGKVAQTRLPAAGWDLRPDLSRRQLLFRSTLAPDLQAGRNFTTHEAEAARIGRLAVPAKDVFKKGRWGNDWYTLDLSKLQFSADASPSLQPSKWKHVRRFRSNGTGAFWP